MPAHSTPTPSPLPGPEFPVTPSWLRGPTGTRDFPPVDFNRRRYIQEAWRRVSVLHGFDEVDGPAFEHVEMFVRNSGATLAGHAFTFSSRGGEVIFALRPEFTPTIARMFAERHAQLPRPTRWFSTGNCFRAEKASSGRLREFFQWNCDILGDSSARADGEIVACCAAMLERVGLTPADVRIALSDRRVVACLLTGLGVQAARLEEAFDLLDLRGKVPEARMAKQARELGFDLPAFEALAGGIAANFAAGRFGSLLSGIDSVVLGGCSGLDENDLYHLSDLAGELALSGVLRWCDLRLGVVRGLAYYTGMVFEVEATGTRAGLSLGGGGRYDGLIERFGGPPTPAVGFGIADAPLGTLLAERGLLPSEQALRSVLGAQPDAIVAIEEPDHEASDQVPGVLATLRGVGVHARRARATGRAAAGAETAETGARFCIVLTGGSVAEVTDGAMPTAKPRQVGLGELANVILAEKLRPSGSPQARAVATTTN